MHLDRVDFGFGFRPLYFFHQPLLESTLHEGVQRFDCVTVQRGLELTELSQMETQAMVVLG
jgi:3-(3-hydroxy-phenyl)propionate hydroxylase